MDSGITAPPVAPPPAPARRARRRWPWLVLAAGLLAAGGFLAREGWAAWQERSARRAAAEERFDDARQHLERALRVRPRSASALLLAARVARQRGAYSEAEQYLTRCAEYNGMSEPLQLEWLLLRCQRGEVDELAPGLWAQVKAGHPDSVAILEGLAAVYMRTARYREAVECLDRWVELAPTSARALDWRGWVSNQLDHRGQALADYERALELQPDRPLIRQRLAEILVDSTRHAEALPHLERLRAQEPDNPEVMVLLARCYLAQSRTEEARALLDAVLAAHQQHFEALLRRGELEYSERHFAEAERWQRQALEQKPLDPEGRYALYLSLRAQGDRQKDAQDELARWERDRRSRDRLVRLLRTELDMKPNDPALAREAGELFLQLGEDQRGLFWLRRALERNPRYAPALKALLAYYERTNNPDKAAEYRQRLAALPEDKAPR
jgi:tetratricopeptide (TPR) repeat protein